MEAFTVAYFISFQRGRGSFYCINIQQVLYFGNNEQILAQVDDSYNWYTLSVEPNDEIELEAY